MTLKVDIFPNEIEIVIDSLTKLYTNIINRNFDILWIFSESFINVICRFSPVTSSSSLIWFKFLGTYIYVDSLKNIEAKVIKLSI